mmetsp:Transcript_55324/g.49826  ORF Transcript_55324/g.49826 Transcript_55324/m.49826 type:complete len:96 (-) Transcript_55324:88-375(-)
MSSTTDRYNIMAQLEHLQSKYVGTGHADTTKHEWLQNQHRDSYASYIGHQSMLHYFAIAENESIGRMKYKFLQRMVVPCGVEPKKNDRQQQQQQK